MNLADRDGFIWQDGQLVDWREAKTHVLTHTLHYSMGVFEGVRAYETPNGTAIFRLKEHTKRLLNSAKIYQMKVPFDQATSLRHNLNARLLDAQGSTRCSYLMLSLYTSSRLDGDG